MAYEPGSFRDRHGRVFYADDRVLRGLSETAAAHWRSLQEKPFYRRLSEAGRIVDTRESQADAVEGWACVLEHERIPFVSYPYEWSFGMLKDAALTTLEILDAALSEGFTLKDASAYNVQFVGARPTFIDIPSLEPLGEGEPWTGYRQFCQLFLFPLLLQVHREIPFQPLLRGALDGIDPQFAASILAGWSKFKRGVFTHVYLQSRLVNRYAGKQQDVRKNIKSAGFNKELIKSNVRGLRKLVSGLEWNPKGSEWGDYTAFHNYSDEDARGKADFVAAAAAEVKPALCWDLGCNTGQFSVLAAEHSDYVVAMDFDHLAIEKLYRSLGQSNITNVLPLVCNLADPAPALGWRNRERKTLTDRQAPDLVLALALIHHVVISANVPLEEFVNWLADLTPNLVIEFVTKDDGMVKRLLQNKDDQYVDYELDNFERCLRARYDVRRREALSSGNRYLYHCARPS